jgi:U2-associated protein SR140
MAPKTSFSMVRKKTPFEKHKEEEELKRKRDAEEAANLFAEFEADFASEKKPKAMSFVSAGVQGAGSRPGDEIGQSGRGKVYVPTLAPPGFFGAEDEPEAKPAPTSDHNARSSQPSGFGSAPGPSGGGRKPRAIDAVMEEMMEKQQRREDARREGRELVEDQGRGAHPSDLASNDKTTTNVFVGNLPLTVVEEDLLRDFAQFGPIGSVKIMWPRGEDIRTAQTLTGFVSFMGRASAERMVAEMEGKTYRGCDLRVGWGKAVKLPAKPIWPIDTDDFPDRPAVGVPGTMPSTQGGYREEVEVQYPVNARVMYVIDRLAKYVVDNGKLFEEKVMEKERGNEEFNFLFDYKSPNHRYYKWRVFSLTNGDTLEAWATETFVMNDARWIPPNPKRRPVYTGKESDASKEPTDPDSLKPGDREELEELLQTLTLERSDIQEGMMFALEHADSAKEVANILTDALTLSDTPVTMKVARLFLMSDILHNCGAPVKNASAYRIEFQQKLPRVFESLEKTLKDVDSRITREAFKKRVAAVLTAWGDWFLFGEEFLKGLELTFLRGEAAK